jgi:hypothetical protein
MLFLLFHIFNRSNESKDWKQYRCLDIYNLTTISSSWTTNYSMKLKNEEYRAVSIKILNVTLNYKYPFLGFISPDYP